MELSVANNRAGYTGSVFKPTTDESSKSSKGIKSSTSNTTKKEGSPTSNPVKTDELLRKELNIETKPKSLRSFLKQQISDLFRGKPKDPSYNAVQSACNQITELSDAVKQDVTKSISAIDRTGANLVKIATDLDSVERTEMKNDIKTNLKDIKTVAKTFINPLKTIIKEAKKEGHEAVKEPIKHLSNEIENKMTEAVGQKIVDSECINTSINSTIDLVLNGGGILKKCTEETIDPILKSTEKFLEENTKQSATLDLGTFALFTIFKEGVNEAIGTIDM